MLKVILNRLKPQAEEIIVEEQAGCRRGESSAEHILDLRVLCKKHSQYQQDAYHTFFDLKKAFDRMRHDALWANMNKYNMGQKITHTIQLVRCSRLQVQCLSMVQLGSGSIRQSASDRVVSFPRHCSTSSLSGL